MLIFLFINDVNENINNNKDNEKHKKDIQKQLKKICEKFHFFEKRILTNKYGNEKMMA